MPVAHFRRIARNQGVYSADFQLRPIYFARTSRETEVGSDFAMLQKAHEHVNVSNVEVAAAKEQGNGE
jgi:hypothetical protein